MNKYLLPVIKIIKKKFWLASILAVCFAGAFFFTCSEPEPYDLYFASAPRAISPDDLDLTCDRLVWTRGLPTFPETGPYSVTNSEGFSFSRQFIRYNVGKYLAEKKESQVLTDDQSEQSIWAVDNSVKVEYSQTSTSIEINGFSFSFYRANRDFMTRSSFYRKYAADGKPLTDEIEGWPENPTASEIKDGIYIWQVIGYPVDQSKPLLVCGVASPDSKYLTGSSRPGNDMLLVSKYNYRDTLDKLEYRVRFERTMYNFFKCACNCVDRCK